MKRVLKPLKESDKKPLKENIEEPKKVTLSNIIKEYWSFGDEDEETLNYFLYDLFTAFGIGHPNPNPPLPSRSRIMEIIEEYIPLDEDVLARLTGEIFQFFANRKNAV